MRPAFLSILFPLATLLAQPPTWDFYGLSGRTVYDLRHYGAKVYAATDTGVYVCALPSWDEPPKWTLVGLAGKSVLSVYPHDVGPLGYAVTAGLQRRYGDPDSCVICCSQFSDSAWAPADTGIDRSELDRIEGIDGFPDPRICGETFAGGSGKIYRRTIGGAWEKVFDFGIGVINVVRTRLNPPTVMAGGEGAIFNPFITRSEDLGDSWTTTFPWLGGDNACNSLWFDPTDTSSVYAGMEGAIIRSTDGGKTWISAGLSSTPYYFFGIEYAEMQASRNLYAVGASGTNDFVMYLGVLGSDIWSTILPPWPLKGARCIASVPAPFGSRFLIGTLGDGVISFTDVYASVKEEDLPSSIQLQQNYPNPFNASTTILYELSIRTHVRIDVFDALGRELETLVDEEQPPGHRTIQFQAEILPSGLYTVRLTTSTGTISRTMILLK